MKHGLGLILIGVAQVILAATSLPVGILLAWSGVSWIVAGLTYLIVDIASTFIAEVTSSYPKP